MDEQEKALVAPDEGVELSDKGISFTTSIAEPKPSGNPKVTPIRADIGLAAPSDLAYHLANQGFDAGPGRWAIVPEVVGHPTAYTVINDTAPKEHPELHALDPSQWAHRIADLGHLGWFHGDLYGLADDMIYRPITGQVEQFVESLSNAFRSIGAKKIGKTRGRVADVLWHLEHGSLARPSDQDWLAWDRAHWNRPEGIPFQNGLLDLRTLRLRAITPDDWLTWQLPFEWADAMTSHAGEFWMQHFENLFGTGPQAQSKVRTLLVRSAVALTPWVRGARWQKALMLIGPGENGKGTWIRLWEHILGTQYQSMALADYDDDSRFGLSGLRPDTLIAATPDMDEKARLKGTARFKSLTGDDPLTWERKNRDIVTTQFRARVWLAGPVVPQVGDSSDGMFRRLDGAIVHFNRRQPRNDAYEETMLTQENVEALLHLAITALSRVVTGTDPMPRPDDSDDLIAEYRQQISPLEQWLGDEGWLQAVDGDEAHQAFVATDRLMQVYRHWYQAYTGDRYPKYMSRVQFGKKLQAQFAKAQPEMPNGKRPHGYRGLRIRPEWDRTWNDE